MVWQFQISKSKTVTAASVNTYHIENRFGQVAVELSKTVGEFGDIDSNELIGVLYTVVQCGNSVKCKL